MTRIVYIGTALKPKGFWLTLCRWSYRHAAKASPVKPVGIPMNRDPASPCTSYEPREAVDADWRDCQTDGHYLCAECAHISDEAVEWRKMK